MCHTVITLDGDELSTRQELANWLGVAHEELPVAKNYGKADPSDGGVCLCTVDLLAIPRIRHNDETCEYEEVRAAAPARGEDGRDA